MAGSWGKIKTDSMSGLRRSLSSAFLPPPALAVHLQNMHVMGEPIQQRAGQPLRAQHFGPSLKRQVDGNQSRAPLVALDREREHYASHAMTQHPSSAALLTRAPRYAFGFWPLGTIARQRDLLLSGAGIVLHHDGRVRRSLRCWGKHYAYLAAFSWGQARLASIRF